MFEKVGTGKIFVGILAIGVLGFLYFNGVLGSIFQGFQNWIGANQDGIFKIVLVGIAAYAVFAWLNQRKLLSSLPTLTSPNAAFSNLASSEDRFTKALYAQLETFYRPDIQGGGMKVTEAQTQNAMFDMNYTLAVAGLPKHSYPSQVKLRLDAKEFSNPAGPSRFRSYSEKRMDLTELEASGTYGAAFKINGATMHNYLKILERASEDAETPEERIRLAEAVAKAKGEIKPQQGVG